MQKRPVSLSQHMKGGVPVMGFKIKALARFERHVNGNAARATSLTGSFILKQKFERGSPNRSVQCCYCPTNAHAQMIVNRFLRFLSPLITHF